MVQSVDINEAVALLEEGRAVVFPTDTVFGLGLSPRHAVTPQLLYQLKGRDEGKPVAWLVPNAEALGEWGSRVPAYAWDLARAHWPGALTLIVAAADVVPAAYRSAAGTIGLRMPDSPEALALMDALGGPVATTSANLSGEPAVSDAAQLDPRLLENAPVFVPVSRSQAGSTASTVVDCTGEDPVVLRQGPVHL
ncbi:MAG: threonylcarbamoyl-AMP synthase [Eggerthellaceae bacterium]|nr:threonylcarbamoyl-AMP synthase [Eggerthellaceae bacterium]